jgi:hypothetical protein
MPSFSVSACLPGDKFLIHRFMVNQEFSDVKFFHTFFVLLLFFVSILNKDEKNRRKTHKLLQHIAMLAYYSVV